MFQSGGSGPAAADPGSLLRGTIISRPVGAGGGSEALHGGDHPDNPVSHIEDDAQGKYTRRMQSFLLLSSASASKRMGPNHRRW